MLRTLALTGLLGLIASCGGKTVAFQGENTIGIAGNVAAAPVAADPPRVEVRDNKIAINEKIQFAYDQATILPASFSLLDEVASVIQKNPHIKKIQIEGHASSEGNATHNLKLSDARARAVLVYLSQHGVSKQMLTAKGFGIDKPIADNSTDAGREQNRRVEFNIVEQDVTTRKVEIDPTGKEKIIEEKKADTTTSSK